MEQLSIEEIIDLREPVRRLCRDRFDRSAVRESGAAAVLDLAAWELLVEIGVIGATAPTKHGGADLGMQAAVGLWEECGLGLAPGPITWSALAAELADDVADGTMIVAGACGLNVPLMASHLGEAGALVVLGEDVRIYRPDEVEASSLRSVDPYVPMWRVEALSDGSLLGDGATARTLRIRGACLTAAYLLGVAGLAVQLALGHARDRHQFGRPIGGFQAVKHLLSDMATATEVAGHAVRAAAAAIDAAAPEATRLCSVAKTVAGDAALLASRGAIQIHGGIGYAWEADPHLVWKRALVHDVEFGTADRHAEQVAESLSPPEITR